MEDEPKPKAFDVRRLSSVGKLHTLISNGEYRKVLDNLKEQMPAAIENHIAQNLLAYILQPLTIRFSRIESTERDELLVYCLTNLEATKLLNVWRSKILNMDSHILTRMFVRALCEKMDKFDRNCQAWYELMYEVPYLKECDVVKALEENRVVEPRRYFIEGFKDLLSFYICADAKHLKFTRAMQAFYKHFNLQSIEFEELRDNYATISPFHPFTVLQIKVGDQSLIRQVHSHLFVIKSLIEGLLDYTNVSEDDRQFIDDLAVNASLEMLLAKIELVTALPEAFTSLFEKLIYALFPHMEDVSYLMDPGSKRGEMVTIVTNIVKKYPNDKGMLLILRSTAEKLRRGRETFKCQPQLFAWIIDMYRKKLYVDIFQQEAGYFISEVSGVVYEDMNLAESYYSSIIVFYMTMIVMRIKPMLAKAIRDKIICPIRAQLSDFIQLRAAQQEGPIDEVTMVIENTNERYKISAAKSLLTYQLAMARDYHCVWENELRTREEQEALQKTQEQEAQRKAQEEHENAKRQ